MIPHVSPHRCRVELLGDAWLSVGRERSRFAPDKRYALLAYLALVGDWVGREEVARLFWSEQGLPEAKRNLRQLLQRLQALEVCRACGLEVARQRLRWQVASDVADFEEALTAGALERATALYRGPLLRGLENYDSAAYMRWLEFERAGLHGRWRDALLRRAESLAQDQPAAAARWLGELLKRDPLDEPALAGLMSALAHAGQRDQALGAYRLFARRLAAELGLEPSAATHGLAKRIEEAPRQARVAPAPLSTAAHSFFGREGELAELLRMLGRVDCRLLTVTGPGGVGKSRLALQALREVAPRFAGAGFVVALAAVRAPEGIAVAIAEAAGLELQGPDPPLAQLERWIGERELLVVLDNAEHLLAGAAMLAGLLGRCPGLKLLVTSRERLGLHEEWLLPLSGLACPEEGVSAERALDYAAVALFVERARRVRPDFALLEELPHVVAICRMVGGSPLTIELAAVWVRALPCSEIAQEILGNLDFLTATSRDAPDRHRSVRAVFEHSWKLLTPLEQRVLRKLAVCRGGFRSEAAAAVAGAPVSVLGALLDKSLLSVNAAGRYLRHPLLYSFSRDKLAEHPAEAARARSRHGGYYLHFAWQRGPAYKGGPGERGALEALEEELANVTAAWRWALEAKRWRDLRAALKPLMLFYDLRGRYREGLELFAASAEPYEAAAEERALKGELLVSQAALHLLLGSFADVRRLAEGGLALLPRAGGGWARVTGLNALGLSALIGGAFAQAQRFWAEALALAKRRRDSLASLELVSSLALACAWSGEAALAARHLEEASARRRSVGMHRASVYSLLTAGFAQLASGEAERARLLQDEGLGLARELGEQRYLPHLHFGLGMTALELGKPEAALVSCGEALDLARSSGDVLAETWALVVMSEAAHALGEGARACELAVASLQLAQASHNLMALPHTLVLAAGAWSARDGSRAAALLGRALRQPGMGALARRRAESLLASLPSVPVLEAPHDTWTTLADEVLRGLAAGAQALT